jgi:hypothetical protein
MDSPKKIVEVKTKEDRFQFFMPKTFDEFVQNLFEFSDSDALGIKKFIRNHKIYYTNATSSKVRIQN